MDFKLKKNLIVYAGLTTHLVQWSARLTAIQEVPGSIPGYTLEIFLEVQGLERGPPSLVRPIGQLLDMRSSEIWLRKLKLRLRDNALLTTKSPVLSSGSQPLQSVVALWSCSATEKSMLDRIYTLKPSRCPHHITRLFKVTRMCLYWIRFLLAFGITEYSWHRQI